ARGEGGRAAAGPEATARPDPAVPAQHPHGLALGHVPEAHGLVDAAGGELRAVRAEGHVADRLLVPGQRRDRLVPLGTPEADEAVRAARRQRRPRGGKRRPGGQPPVAGGAAPLPPEPTRGPAPAAGVIRAATPGRPAPAR